MTVVVTVTVPVAVTEDVIDFVCNKGLVGVRVTLACKTESFESKKVFDDFIHCTESYFMAVMLTVMMWQHCAAVTATRCSWQIRVKGIILK